MAAKTIKCHWCGQLKRVKPNQRVEPHKNGAQLCPGGGQESLLHHNLSRLRQANPKGATW